LLCRIWVFASLVSSVSSSSCTWSTQLLGYDELLNGADWREETASGSYSNTEDTDSVGRWQVLDDESLSSRTRRRALDASRVRFANPARDCKYNIALVLHLKTDEGERASPIGSRVPSRSGLWNNWSAVWVGAHPASCTGLRLLAACYVTPPTKRVIGVGRFRDCRPRLQQEASARIGPLKPTLLDTGVIVGLLDRSESHHTR